MTTPAPTTAASATGAPNTSDPPSPDEAASVDATTLSPVDVQAGRAAGFGVRIGLEVRQVNALHAASADVVVADRTELLDRA